jgi:hypothetical protein
MESIAEDVAWLRANHPDYSEMQAKIQAYLHGWVPAEGGSVNAYLYDPKTREVCSGEFLEERIREILRSSVNPALENFYRQSGRFPSEEEWESLRGEFPELPMGRAYRYRPSDGEAWAE